MSKYEILEKRLETLKNQLVERHRALAYAEETKQALIAYQHDHVTIEISGLTFPIPLPKAIELVSDECVTTQMELDDAYQQVNDALVAING